jgi:hypothetical protein
MSIFPLFANIYFNYNELEEHMKKEQNQNGGWDIFYTARTKENGKTIVKKIVVRTFDTEMEADRFLKYRTELVSLQDVNI